MNDFSLRGQTVHFENCKRIPQGRSFCSVFFFHHSDKILTCLKTRVWNPGTYRHNVVRLSSAQTGLVMLDEKKIPSKNYINFLEF